MRSALHLLLLASLCLSLGACTDSSPSSPRLAEMTWLLGDSCPDGNGIQARLFDVDRGGVWPSLDQVFFAEPGGEIDTTISCQRGLLICYGAATDPDTGVFWGVDIDGLQDCEDCCERCDDILVSFDLSC